MTKSRFKQTFRVLLSISVAAAAICLMAACVGICASGSQPFSRESVEEAFGRISIPVYLCLGLVVLGGVLELFLPEEKRPQAKRAPLSAKPAARLTARQEARLRWALLSLSIFLSVFGFNIGGAADVLTKAINICTECIGLG